MTKEVIVTVKGMHFVDDNDGEKVEVIIPGTYYNKGDSHYIFYEEVMEGVDDILKNRIVIVGDRVEVIKSGKISVGMQFDRISAYETEYKTPFGVFPFRIVTSEIKIEESEKLISCDIKYTLEMEETKISDCELSIKVKPQGSVSLA
ncbi:MAG: DUF1934 domain-containing protein [Lachnospiraceae bacterium]|nr:DUF1934 domain-containing protein [Lachnospiraceae bacterium]